MSNGLLLLFGLIALLCAVLLYIEYRERLKSLEGRVKNLEQVEARMKKLEEANSKRINYTSLEEIEHAMTALAVLREDLNTRSNMVENAIAHLSKAHTPKAKS